MSWSKDGPAIRVDTPHSLATIQRGGKIGNPRRTLHTFSPLTRNRDVEERKLRERNGLRGQWELVFGSFGP